jgi:hypothetical protein
MSSHFASIGFSVDKDEDLIGLAERAARQAERVETRHGAYLCWRCSSGAELWLQLDREQRLVGMNPHFDGGARVRVGLTDALRRPPLALDGAFEGVADPHDDSPTKGAHRIAFDCPNFRACDDVELPSMATVQVAAFAHDLRVFESVEDYEAAVAGTTSALESQAYVPAGLLHPERGVPPTLALIAGHIRRAERRVNSLSGRPFHWLSVRSAGGVLDVVVGPELLPEEPRFGGVLTGSFWVSGRLLSYVQRRPSFIRRMLTPPPMRKVGG